MSLFLSEVSGKRTGHYIIAIDFVFIFVTFYVYLQVYDSVAYQYC